MRAFDIRALRIPSEGTDLVGICCATGTEIARLGSEDLVDVDELRDAAVTDLGYDWPRCVRCGQKIDAV